MLAAKSDGVLPPFVIIAGAMLFGAVTIGVLAVVGLLPMRATFGTVELLGARAPWFVPILAITIVAAVIAYVLGIVGAQRLGTKVASFVSLTEVLFAVVASWLMIGDVPGPVQALGGALIVAGVVLVRMDEARTPAAAPVSESLLEAATGPLPVVQPRA